MSLPARLWLPTKALDSDPELRLGDFLWIERSDGARSVWRQKMKVVVIYDYGYVLEKTEL